MKKLRLRRLSHFRHCEINGIAIIVSIFTFLFIGILVRALSGSPLYMMRLSDIHDILPPIWVFILVWSIWYVLLGFCFGFVIGGSFPGRRTEKFKGSLCLVVMMVFNYIWYPLFFSAKTPFLALADILIIAFFCFLTFLEYRKISKLIAFIILVHFLWIIWCFSLNFKIFIGI